MKKDIGHKTLHNRAAPRYLVSSDRYTHPLRRIRSLQRDFAATQHSSLAIFAVNAGSISTFESSFGAFPVLNWTLFGCLVETPPSTL
jgi:hypothetical protein